MLNQTIFVGRLVANPSLQETETGRNMLNITIAVPRSYKNEEGVYLSDFIDCTLWNENAKNTAEYCKKGDIIGIKGRVQTNLIEKDGEKKKYMNIIAEKVTFLASKERNYEQEHEDFEPEMDME